MRFLLVSILILSSPFVFAEDESLRLDLIKGATELLKNTGTTTDPALIADQALKFKARYAEALTRLPAPEQLKQTVTWNNVYFSRSEFSFNSLISGQGSDPNNIVRGFLFKPKSSNCEAHYPATLLIHHIGDDLDPEIQLAKYVSSSNSGIVMLIYLPKYGPRKNPKDNKLFISNNFVEFEDNLLQALLDIRYSYEILRSLPETDTKQMGLMGVSLGGILTLISAGVDPVFDRYGVLVGGGDLAGIMSYRAEKDPNSETSRVLSGITWSEDYARQLLGGFDSITWAHNVKNKYILFLNAADDELINKERGINKLLNIYSQNNNKIEVKTHPGGHRPDFKKLGIWGMLKSIVFPVQKFIRAHGAADGIFCD